MNTQDLVDWIAADLRRTVPALRLVSGAAGFQAAAESNPPATPAAFVFAVQETADEPGFDVPTIQRITASIAVVLVVRHVGDTQGGAASESMDALRADVWTALHGARLDADHEPLSFVSGGLIAFRDQHLWWQDLWSSALYRVST